VGGKTTLAVPEISIGREKTSELALILAGKKEKTEVAYDLKDK